MPLLEVSQTKQLSASIRLTDTTASAQQSQDGVKLVKLCGDCTNLLFTLGIIENNRRHDQQVLLILLKKLVVEQMFPLIVVVCPPVPGTAWQSIESRS